MMESPRVSIIVPVFNEEENLPRLIDEIDGLGTGYETVFVDDHSTDRSFSLLSRVAEQDDAVKVVRLSRNHGQSAAIAAGFDHGSAPFLVTMDADLQFRPGSVSSIVNRLEEGYDVVCGRRTNRLEVDGWHRVLPSRLFNRIGRRLAGTAVTDLSTGMVGIRQEVVDALRLPAEHHRVLPILAGRHGFRIGEADIRIRQRRHGKSKYGLEQLFSGIIALVRIAMPAAGRPVEYTVEEAINC